MDLIAPNLLLLSTSTVYGSGYLDYAEKEVREFLGDARDVIFVPFALHDQDAYAALTIERFVRMGYAMSSLHEAADKQKAVEAADAIFVGGGNTFRLLKAL